MAVKPLNISAFPKGPNYGMVSIRCGSESQGLTTQMALCKTAWLGLGSAGCSGKPVCLIPCYWVGWNTSCLSLPGDQQKPPVFASKIWKTEFWGAVCIPISQWSELPALRERQAHYLEHSTTPDWLSYTRGAEFIIFVGGKASQRKTNK